MGAVGEVAQVPPVDTDLVVDDSQHLSLAQAAHGVNLEQCPGRTPELGAEPQRIREVKW